MKKILAISVIAMTIIMGGWQGIGFSQGGTGIGTNYTTYKQRAAAPATPAATYNRLYFKTDGNLYKVGSTGIEATVGTGALPADASGVLTNDGGGNLTWGASLSITDPNANTLIGWDDTDGVPKPFLLGAGLSYDHASHTVSASTAGDAAADGATKGVAAFVALDFTSAAGVIGIDYANGQAAATGVKGFLTGADWDTFTAKQAAITRPVSGPASATTGHYAVFGASGQIIADGGAAFDPAVPGAIGGTTPAAGTFSGLTVVSGVTVTKDGSNNLVLTDAVTGAKTLASLVPSTPSNLSLSAGEVPASRNGSTLVGVPLLTERIGATFDGGGSAIAVNKIAYVHIPYAVTSIDQWTVVCDVDSGTTGIIITPYMDAYAADTLPTTTMCTTGTPPHTTDGAGAGGLAHQAAWDCNIATIAADRIIGFKVTTAPTSATWCTVSLKVTR